ncbi:hypothetical protein AQUCO_00900227v1 [Aquilegia coerulea]|uniref:Uncharacterized protein n=1 Tax=Aquilegia coerulea TaxID=218851 RepID=A0A2G5ECK0_AQUCA|nr:hypothetical protein AQUCO_00900227v1 [Aquilegia coerulea]
MSLVDYASSSEDEADEQLRNTNEEKQQQEEEEDRKDDNPHTTHNHTSISSSNRALGNVSYVSTSTVEQLPDASMLLNSPTFSSHQMSGNDHYSRVTAAMAESASRKRESNGAVSSHQRSKFPRSNLPHSRNVPETVGGLLVPPQLSGRSNVVTEDLGRLFARRNANPSLHRSSEQLS